MSRVAHRTSHGWKIWTRADCIDALHLACPYDEPPTSAEYDALHHAEPDSYPCLATLKTEFGGWRQALAIIGIEARSRGKAGHTDYIYEHEQEYTIDYRSDWDD